MKKTFLIGFIGLFLVAGFIAGLFLVNRQTNPESSAAGSEVVDEIQPSPTPAEEKEKPVTFEICKKSYAKKPDDPEFNKKCDLNQDGKIDLLDFQKLK